MGLMGSHECGFPTTPSLLRCPILMSDMGLNIPAPEGLIELEEPGRVVASLLGRGAHHKSCMVVKV